MPITNASQATLSPTSKQSQAWVNNNAARKRLESLLRNSPEPRRTEVSELLLRHYADKSRIDVWTSLWHDLSIWRRGHILTSIVSIAGLSGVVVGLALPFAAIAAGILFFANHIIMHHETHRRARGVRFAEETEALEKKLDEMMGNFKVIAAEITVALEQVEIQATVMAKNNAEMTEQTGTLNNRQDTLQDVMSTVCEQTSLMQKAQHDVTLAINSIVTQVQSVDASLEHAAVSIQGLDQSIGRFAETAELMHQTGSNLEKISDGLSDFIQHASLHAQAASQPDTRVEDAITLSRKAIAFAKAQRALRQKVEDNPHIGMNFN